MTSETRFTLSRWPLAVLLAAFTVIACVYAWATPPLEASDELWHVGMVDVLARTGALPVQQPGVDTAWEQEGSQPPLYYALGALLVSPIDRGDFDTLRQPNPHAKAGVPGATDNKNLVLHDDAHPAPLGTALAVYLLRAVGIALGALTVVAVYAAAVELTRRPLVALVAAGLTAFNPMFLFISASVNNDNLVTALNSLILWQTLVMLRRGLTARRSLLLALLIALASLSKLSGLALVPVVALAGLWLAWRRRDLRGLLTLGGAMALLWALLAGWWYVRNLTLYGELFGTATMAAVAGERLTPFTLGTLLDEFEGFRVGYWGWFGAVNITTGALFYRVMDAVVALGVVGLAVAVWRARRDNDALVRIGVLALTLVVGSVALVQWTALTYASQGRLLFPYVAATSPLLALGFDALLRPLGRWAARLPLVGVAALAVFALVTPLTTIAPAYAAPAPLAALPSSAQPVYARFGDVALVGYETPDRRYEPGDRLPLTVYWQVLEPSERDLSLYLHAVDDDGAVIGRIDSFPGGGTLRTTRWQPGAIYADDYDILLERAAGQTRLRVQVGWWHYASEDVVQPTDEAGTPLESVMLDVGGYAGVVDLPTLPNAVDGVAFGDRIALRGYALAQDRVALSWEALGGLDANHTVFVQVLDAGGDVVGSGDAPPDLPTRYWRVGDRVVTTHPLTYETPLAPGRYRVIVGWYNPLDGARLMGPGENGAYELGTLEVEPRAED